MHSLIGNANEQTWLVALALIIFSLVTVKLRPSGILPKEITASIKGIAILTIIFGHVGYFFMVEHTFLPPLSNYSGVGVDLFLLVSGLGLMLSALKTPLAPLQFYKRRLTKVYLPILITIITLALLDFIILHRTYSPILLLKNLVGFFPQADLFNDINSPLWFITPLLVYYLIFPLVYFKRAPWILSLAFLGLGYLQTTTWFLTLLPVNASVQALYRLHAYSFAVGVLIALIVWNLSAWYTAKGQQLILQKQHLFKYLYYLLFLVVSVGLVFVLRDTHVNGTWQAAELASVEASVLIAAFVALLPIHVEGWAEIGAASFVLYLVHTPLMTRFDFLFSWLPGGLALIIYVTGIMMIWKIYGFWQAKRKVVPAIGAEVKK